MRAAWATGVVFIEFSEQRPFDRLREREVGGFRLQRGRIRTMDRGGRVTVAGQILLLQLLVVGLVVAGGFALAWADARRDAENVAADRAVAVALTVADSTAVAEAVRGADPAAVLQPIAEQIRADTGTDFVVIMSTSGVRYTHPNPDNIGKRFIGTIEPAVRGETHVERYSGTLGPSVRAVVPVRAGDIEDAVPGDGGIVVALVAVGITMAQVDEVVLAAVPTLVLAGGVVLALGVIGALLINRRLSRQTHGVGPREITRMFEYYDAVLRSVREGLILLDPQGRVQLINAEAERLLGLPLPEPVSPLPEPVEGPTIQGRALADLDLPDTLVESALAEHPIKDEIHLVGDRMVVVNRQPARWRDHTVGSVITLRDHTEIQAISGELDTVRGLAESLRSQNHESANRLHTVVSLLEMGRTDQAIAFATQELETAQRLTDQVVAAVDDPVVAALLLGKTAQAAERGIELAIDAESAVEESAIEPRDIVTVLGNLLDNALDAAAETEPPHRVRVLVWIRGDQLLAQVGDSGPGLTDAEREHIFDRGWSTKEAGDSWGRGLGLALVVRTVRRYRGEIQVGTSALGGASFEVRIGGQDEQLPLIFPHTSAAS